MARATAAQLVVVADLVAAMLLAAPHTANAIDFDEVKDSFFPCLSYAVGEAPIPSSDCCQGIEYIADADDKCTACGCLATLLTFDKEIDLKLAANIPSMCFVKMPFAITASPADCDGVKLINVA